MLIWSFEKTHNVKANSLARPSCEIVTSKSDMPPTDRIRHCLGRA